MALVTAGATLLYILFFAISDAWFYRPLIALDLICFVFYLLVPLINQIGWHLVVRCLLLFVVSLQLLFSTYFLSADSGVPLFYFTIVSTLPILYSAVWVTSAVTVACMALFIYCNTALSAADMRTPIDAVTLNIVYFLTAFAAVTTTAITVYLFRTRMERIERALRKSNQALERLSTTDQLTNLTNRRGMASCLKREIGRMRREYRPLSLLMCDVDYFKAFNDRHGHPAGDDVLVRLAAVLTESVRRPSDVVVRYGGEEFVLILPDTGVSQARAVAQRLADALAREAIPHAGSEISSCVTFSQGLTTFLPDSNLTAEGLLKAVDQALYAAKRAGRNQIVYRAPHSITAQVMADTAI